MKRLEANLWQYSTEMIYKTEKMFLFDHISLLKQFSIARNTDSAINQTINASR